MRKKKKSNNKPSCSHLKRDIIDTYYLNDYWILVFDEPQGSDFDGAKYEGNMVQLKYKCQDCGDVCLSKRCFMIRDIETKEWVSILET